MFPKLTWIPLVLAAAALLAGPLPAEAEEGPAWLVPQVDYMAHTVMRGAEGEMRGRVWASGDKERRELTVNGTTHVVILRKDRGVSWILMPEQKMYLEQPLAQQGADGLRGGDVRREAFGHEVVNEARTTRYRVHGTAGDGRAFEGQMWMTDHEIPVRVVTGHGRERIEMELDKLSVGPVDPKRFEIPGDYKRFELPGPARADLEALRRRYDKAPADR